MLWKHSIKNTVFCECYWQQAVCNECCQCEAAAIWRAQGEVQKECGGGQHLAMAPTKAEKSQCCICFSQGCATPLVLTTEKKTHTYCWPHLHRCDRKRTEELTPLPCSFRKDGEMKRRGMLTGWMVIFSTSPSLLLHDISVFLCHVNAVHWGGRVASV